MAGRIRNFFAIFAGSLGLLQSYLLYKGHRRDWHLWGELAASVLLLGMGLWRLLHKAADPTAALLE
jgi:uncharacterized membrane protein